MYASLTLFKNYLWIDASDTSSDDILTFYLNSANAIINKYCGVKSFDKTQYEEVVFVKDWSLWNVAIYLNNKPVISIDSIAWNTYTGVKGTDYLVINERKVVLNIPNDSKLIYGYLPIVYTAWYNRNNAWTDEIPADLQLAEMMLACGIKQSKESLGGIQSYKLWDETVTFGSWGSDTADKIYSRVSAILDNYKNFKLNY